MLKKFTSIIHPSWHFYTCISGIITGCALTLWLNLPLCTHYSWLILALLLLIIAIILSRSFALLFALVAGLIFANLRISPELLSQQYFSQLVGQTITITGTISSDPDSSDGSTALSLNHLELHLDDNSAEISGVIYVKLSRSIELNRSDIITLTGKFSGSFGTFAGSMYRPEVVSVDRLDPGDVFVKFKNFFANLVCNFIPSPEVDLGLGYLMGMKTGLSESFSEALRAVGMTHVVVASGAHLAILAGAARKIFGKLSKFAGLLFSLLILLAFACVVGFTPSMTRAVLVAMLSLTFGYVGRKFTPLRLLSLVAALTLLINPSNLLNLGWQLSFASFFGIMILAPRLSKLFYGGKKLPWLASMLITSLATSLTCAPVLIYNFGTISLLSFIANLVILPTLPHAMFLVMLTGATSFLPFLAMLFAKCATLILDLHIWLINFLSEKTIFILNFQAVDLRIFLLYLPVLLFLLWPKLTALFSKPPPEPELCIPE